jgi:hypothetical protein
MLPSLGRRSIDSRSLAAPEPLALDTAGEYGFAGEDSPAVDPGVLVMPVEDDVEDAAANVPDE